MKRVKSFTLQLAATYFLRHLFHGTFVARVLGTNQDSQVGIVHVLIFSDAAFRSTFAQVGRLQVRFAIVGDAISHTNAGTVIVLFVIVLRLARRHACLCRRAWRCCCYMPRRWPISR